MKTASVVAIAASVLAVSSASAGIVVYTNQAIWNSRVATDGLVVETETFNSIADGYQPAPFTGSTASVQWNAFADGGLYVQGGVFSPCMRRAARLRIIDSSGVMPMPPAMNR